MLAQLAPDVDWPNAWEGGRVHGREEVRDYWTRQWAAIDPTVEPIGFPPERATAASSSTCTRSRRALDGTLLAEGDVRHVYAFEGDLVVRMDVEEPG